MSVYALAMKRLLGGGDLDADTAEDLLEALLDGALGPARTAAVLTALAAKGETAVEVAGFAEALRRHALPVKARGPLLDTCGTGGSGLATLNTSTLSALICAAAGVRVAKHGNRASSGACGSMDVLEHLGVPIDLTPEQGQSLLGSGPLAFLNARVHHPALGPLGAIRKSLGFRTVFNLLGPLCNPARPAFQIIGVPDARFGPLLITALRRLGTKRAMVVAGEDGLDEISLATGTRYWELFDDGSTADGLMLPEDFGLKRAPFSQTADGGVHQNAERFLALLRGEDTGPRRDHTILNAGAALYVAGRAGDIEDGADLARDLLAKGEAYRVFLHYRSSAAALLA